jgi:phage-related protein
MADIQYVIGAKDAATPAINKVDSSLERLEKSTKQVGEQSEQSFSKMSLSIGSLAKAAGVFGAISLGISGLRSAFGAIAGGIDDFDAAQESMRALDQAMELNGGSSNALIEKYGALSDAIEANTNIAAEEAQALMKQAAVLGVSNDQLGNMATAAVGLSEALGVSLEDGLKKARLATEGNFKAFEKLIPSIKEMTTDEEKLAAVMELSARGMAMKEAASQSAGGEAARMEHRIGNLMETIGALLAPIREVTYRGISLMADALSNILGPAVEWSQQKFAEWEPIIMSTIQTVVNSVIAGLTMAEVIFSNFGDVVSLVFSTILLKYETYRADTEHLFVTTLPAYISWFGDNFFNIIETAFSAVYTVISNHITKITDAFKAFWDFIASGGGTDLLGQLGEIAGRSYLDGFENSIESMPTIAARALTAREQELQSKIGNISTNLATEFNEKFNSRAVKLGEKVGGELANTIDLELNKATDEAEREIEKKTDVAMLKQPGVSKGVEAAVTASESRLLTRGIVNPKKSLEDLTEQLVKTTQGMAEEISSLRDDLQQVIAVPIP